MPIFAGSKEQTGMKYTKNILAESECDKDLAGSVRKLALDMLALEEYHDVNSHNIWENQGRIKRMESLVTILIMVTIALAIVSIAALIIVHYK